jgi:hypothetical protein
MSSHSPFSKYLFVVVGSQEFCTQQKEHEEGDQEGRGEKALPVIYSSHFNSFSSFPTVLLNVFY